MNPDQISALLAAEQNRAKAQAAMEDHLYKRDYYAKASKREGERFEQAKSKLAQEEKALADLQAKLGQPTGNQLAKKSA